MRCVTVLHQVIVRADNRFSVHSRRTMNRDVFPKYVVVPDPHAGFLAPILQVLWGIANDGAGVETVAAADHSFASKVHMRPKATLSPKFHVLIDNTIGADTG